MIAKNDLTSSNISSDNGEKYQYEFIINTTNGYYYDDPSSVKATSLKALMNKFSKLQIVKSLMVKLGIMVN